MPLRLATFNLENLDDGPNANPQLSDRIRIMRPQLNRIAADILCLQEVNSQEDSNGVRSLNALDQLLAGTPYATYHRQSTLTTGGIFFAERNLTTLSRFPITNTQILRGEDGTQPHYQMVTANPPDTTPSPVKWERPLLYTQIDIGAGRLIHVINLHLKSKLASDIPGQKIDRYTWRTVSAWAEGSFLSSIKRVGQALHVRMQIDTIFDNFGLDALIAVAGDFNATADEVPIKAITGPVEETGNAAHTTRIMVPCENNIADTARYSLFHLGKGEMIDHVIVSRPLIRYFDHAEIHNEALPDESGAFRTDANFPESDHAPVVAAFNFVPEM